MLLWHKPTNKGASRTTKPTHPTTKQASYSSRTEWTNWNKEIMQIYVLRQYTTTWVLDPKNVAFHCECIAREVSAAAPWTPLQCQLFRPSCMYTIGLALRESLYADVPLPELPLDELICTSEWVKRPSPILVDWTIRNQWVQGSGRVKTMTLKIDTSQFLAKC